MESANLTGDDLAAYNQALKLKGDGVQSFKKKKLEKAKGELESALAEIDKIQNKNTDANLLEGQLCQNVALIHKQSDNLPESLKMSERALGADPNNWKALLNKADLSSKLAVPEDERDMSDAMRALKNKSGDKSEADYKFIDDEVNIYRTAI